MSAPVFIQRRSMFNGLGADHVTFTDDEALTITGNVAPATHGGHVENPVKSHLPSIISDPATPMLAKALALGGAGAALLGAALFFTGNKKTGTTLGLGGLVAAGAGLAYKAYVTGSPFKGVPFAGLHGATVVIQPGSMV